MDTETQKLIDEQFKILPEALQRAITLTPWRNTVYDLAKLNNLDSNKTEKLETEVMLVVYGFESQNDLVKNITDNLPTDITRAKLLVEKIDEQILSEILSQANKIESEGPKETLQSIVSTNTEPKEGVSLASTVIVEKHSDLPMIVENKPKTSLTFEERKKLVPNLPDNKSHYADKIDPYREQI